MCSYELKNVFNLNERNWFYINFYYSLCFAIVRILHIIILIISDFFLLYIWKGNWLSSFFEFSVMDLQTSREATLKRNLSVSAKDICSKFISAAFFIYP
jgi:hypothetical protein